MLADVLDGTVALIAIRSIGGGMLGSGFVVPAREPGLIMTNRHVVDGADWVLVRMRDRVEFKARVWQRDGKSDLAVLRIEPDASWYRFKPIAVAPRSNTIIGMNVYAAGTPLTDALDFTVTRGIVSADKRLLDNVLYIQHDAAINPGNSGGPLVNERRAGDRRQHDEDPGRAGARLRHPERGDRRLPPAVRDPVTTPKDAAAFTSDAPLSGEVTVGPGGFPRLKRRLDEPWRGDLRARHLLLAEIEANSRVPLASLPLVPLLSAGDAPEPWLMREFFERGTIAHRIRAAAWPSGGELLTIASWLVAAADELESLGLFHGDPSPSNVFITPEGTVRLGDLASSRAAFASGGVARRPGSDGRTDRGRMLRWLLPLARRCDETDPLVRTLVGALAGGATEEMQVLAAPAPRRGAGGRGRPRRGGAGAAVARARGAPGAASRRRRGRSRARRQGNVPRRQAPRGPDRTAGPGPPGRDPGRHRALRGVLSRRGDRARGPDRRAERPGADPAGRHPGLTGLLPDRRGRRGEERAGLRLQVPLDGRERLGVFRELHPRLVEELLLGLPGVGIRLAREPLREVVRRPASAWRA